jgi:hypothetical protein
MITRLCAVLVLVLIGSSSPAAADPPAPSPAPAPTAAPVPGVPGVSLPPSVMNNPMVQDALRALTGAATRELGLDPNWSRGRVTYFRRFEMQIETVPNKFREIHLHQGTTINPRGTTLAPGMNVRVSGVHQPDGSLNANEITVGG